MSWEPDADASVCRVCAKTFGVFRPKHHCRRCCRVVCGACSRERLAPDEASEAVRVCDSCTEYVALVAVGFRRAPRSRAFVNAAVHAAGVTIDGRTFAYDDIIAVSADRRALRSGLLEFEWLDRSTSPPRARRIRLETPCAQTMHRSMTAFIRHISATKKGGGLATAAAATVRAASKQQREEEEDSEDEKPPPAAAARPQQPNLLTPFEDAEPAPAPSAATFVERRLLVTHRAPSLFAHAAFPEVYACATCDDCFGLAWLPPDTTALDDGHCTTVDATRDAAGRRVLLTRYDASLAVFCPRCSSPMPVYGAIPVGPSNDVLASAATTVAAAATAAAAPPLTPLRVLAYGRAGGGNRLSGARRLSLLGFDDVRRLVILFTYDALFAADADATPLACDALAAYALDAAALSRHEREALSPTPPLPIALLACARLVADSASLLAAVARVMPSEVADYAVVGVVGPIAAKSPFDEVAFIALR